LQAVVAAGHEVHLAGRSRPNIEGASWHGFIGKEGELATFFRQVNLNLHLSILDNLPNTLAEASIFGVPSLIRVRVGGSLELTPEEFRSWAVFPENGSEAIEFVVRRIREVVSRPEIGELFRRHVQELMDPRKIAARYERLFTDLFRNGKV
jgi:glycosyltransferase involved in cell wall biosynthesis